MKIRGKSTRKAPATTESLMTCRGALAALAVLAALASQDYDIITRIEHQAVNINFSIQREHLRFTVLFRFTHLGFNSSVSYLTFNFYHLVKLVKWKSSKLNNNKIVENFLLGFYKQKAS